jgi:hypothetical protein
MIDIVLGKIKAAVEAGGGDYVAIWEMGRMRLVLFNSPQTRSTLALTVAEVLEDGYGAENVRECIRESDAKFASASAIAAPKPGQDRYR